MFGLFKKTLNPRYFLTWLAVALLAALVLLPYRWQIKLGTWLGHFLYQILSYRRHISLRNLSLCFPELNNVELNQLNRNHFASLGIAIFEMGLAWWKNDHYLKKLISLEGWEHIQSALKNGHSILLLGAHFTTLEICGRLVSQLMPINITYREQKNPVMNFLFTYYRSRFCSSLIHRNDIKGVIRKLKNRKIIWYAADQDYGVRHSIFVPFFHQSAATITLPVRYSQLGKALVVPCAHYRLPNAQGYHLVFQAPLTNFPSINLEKDLTLLNQTIENLIRREPAQYYWVHRRYKTRPAGQISLY